MSCKQGCFGKESVEIYQGNSPLPCGTSTFLSYSNPDLSAASMKAVHSVKVKGSVVGTPADHL